MKFLRNELMKMDANMVSMMCFILLRYLVEKCIELDCLLSPTIITADIEVATHQGIRDTFPNVKDCRFHPGQSWYKIMVIH